MLSTRIKEELGYVKDGKKGFEQVVTTLQMQTFLAVESFAHSRDRFGKPYGWGIARYCTAEQRFGEELVNARSCEPEESFLRMVDHLASVLPHADRAALAKWMR